MIHISSFKTSNTAKKQKDNFKRAISKLVVDWVAHIHFQCKIYLKDSATH